VQQPATTPAALEHIYYEKQYWFPCRHYPLGICWVHGERGKSGGRSNWKDRRYGVQDRLRQGQHYVRSQVQRRQL